MTSCCRHTADIEQAGLAGAAVVQFISHGCSHTHASARRRQTIRLSAMLLQNSAMRSAALACAGQGRAPAVQSGCRPQLAPSRCRPQLAPSRRPQVAVAAAAAATDESWTYAQPQSSCAPCHRLPCKLPVANCLCWAVSQQPAHSGGVHPHSGSAGSEVQAVRWKQGEGSLHH